MSRYYKRVDFKLLRRSIDIGKVCDLLGVQLKKMGNGQMRGACPICEHESARAFVVTPRLGLFFCFADCRDGGDAIALVAAVKNMTAREAAYFLVNHFKAL